MDNNLYEIIDENLNLDLIDIILSNSGDPNFSKVKIRPIILKESLMFQASEFKGQQVFHQNLTKEELLNQLTIWLGQVMKQMLLRTKTKQITALISKKGKVTVKKKVVSLSNELIDRTVLSHNREKNYILKEGNKIPFLIDLGVMTKEGKIVNAKYDKFKQINRFLEFIEDIVPNLPKDRELTLIDFGCGKSYLTFAMYYYLKELRGYSIQVIGLDLKKEVIRHCNELAKRYGYDKLTFLEGDIASYDGIDKVDMVVSLHACNTATDYALYKAISWGAKVILCVPCCQHELNAQIKSNELEPILNYGLIKERMSALITDALRAELLDVVGYKTQILEFVDMEHTPKNILIRAVKKDSKEENQSNSNLRLKEYENCKTFLGVEPTLYQLLSDYYPLS